MVDLEAGTVVTSNLVQPTLPSGCIGDAVGVPECVRSPTLPVGHRRPPQQRHRDL